MYRNEEDRSSNLKWKSKRKSEKAGSEQNAVDF